ncbi:hypothetical protein TNCV_520541 [Trichonephila clavipes]|nr:hypothetical protein TNCV_520541 [Trichonephila clavipes]
MPMVFIACGRLLMWPLANREITVKAAVFRRWNPEKCYPAQQVSGSDYVETFLYLSNRAFCLSPERVPDYPDYWS